MALEYRDFGELGYYNRYLCARGESSDTCTTLALIKKTLFAFPVTCNFQQGQCPSCGRLLRLAVCPQGLWEPSRQEEISLDPPLFPCLWLIKPSFSSISSHTLDCTHHCHGVPGLWGQLGTPNWSQHPSVAFPPLPLSCLAHPGGTPQRPLVRRRSSAFSVHLNSCLYFSTSC